MIRNLDTGSRAAADDSAVEEGHGDPGRRLGDQLFRAFADHSTDVFWIIDAETGQLQYLSPAFETIWGDARATLMGDIHRWVDYVHPEDREAVAGALPRLLAGEASTQTYRILRHGDGAVRHIRDTGFPIRDASGTIRAVGGVAQDVSDQRRSETALRTSEERLRQFGEASQDVLWIRDAKTLQWVYLTPAFEMIYGISREEALSGDTYRNWLDLIVPEDRPKASENIARVRDGQPTTFEFRVTRPDGEIRWLRNTDFPILDPTGEVALIGGVGHDLTDIKQAEDQLLRSQERLSSAIEVGGLGLWDWDVRANTVHWSDEHFRQEGYAVGEVIPSYEAWASRIHPDDRQQTEQALRDAMADHHDYIREFRVVHSDGSVHWLSGRGRFFYEDDQPVRMVGAMADVTERRQWENRQKVLVAELQHRTRNLIAVVRSIADKTARGSADLADFRGRFRDRLEALARVQGLLSRLDEHDRVTFDTLIRSELSAVHGSSDRVTLTGEDGIRLRSSMVQALAMALHELATNAVKYGALGQPDARLEVHWHRGEPDEQGQPLLHIAWRERGVDMRDRNGSRRGTGQGRELIERALPYQFGARTRFILESDGVNCRIEIPVSNRSFPERRKSGISPPDDLL